MKMPEGKYFFIESKLNDLVLDVSGASEDPGAKVVTWERGDDNKPNQLWWVDHYTNTIRTKLNNFCMEIENGELVVNPYKEGEAEQQWIIHQDSIVNRNDRERTLDIAEENSDPGAKIIAWQYNGNSNQEWRYHHVEAEFFWLVSEMNGKAMDIEGGDSSSGAKVIMYEKKDDAEDNQLWYEDKHGCICSKLNEFCLDSSSGEICMSDGPPRTHSRYWILAENRIVNYHKRDLVLDISECCEDDGAKLIAYEYNGGSNQHWERVPV